jgi:hypothetical protein
MRKLFQIFTFSILIITSCKKEKSEPTFDCTITKINILSIPERNYKGEKWDSLDNPDIFMKLVNWGEILDDSSNRFENNSTYPLNWTPYRPFRCFGEKHQWIAIMEFDSLKGEEVIAAWDFVPSTYQNRPKIINLKSGLSSINLEIDWW